jgi:hypothetical protein
MTDRLAVCLLLLGCVGFGTIILAEVGSTTRHEAGAIEVLPRPPRAVAFLQQRSSQLDELVATALARPLFSATRRPSQQVASNSATDPGLASTRLTGIVTAPGRRLAIFVVTGAKPLTLVEGETVSGWHIESITPRQVSLSGLGETKTLEPKADESPVLPGTPAAGPPKLTFSRVLPDQQIRDDE